MPFKIILSSLGLLSDEWNSLSAFECKPKDEKNEYMDGLKTYGGRKVTSGIEMRQEFDEIHCT